MSSKRRLPLLVVTGLMAGCSAIDGLLNNDPNLAIRKFAVSPKEVAAGSTATLSWKVDGADVVEIDNGVGIVKGEGSLELRVDRSKAYTLSARSGTSAASSTVQLVVTGTTLLPTPSPSVTPTPTVSPSPTPSPSLSPTPSPSAGNSCRLSSMPDCSASERPTGVFGCCFTDKARPLPSSPFDDMVDAEQDAIEREKPGLFDRDGKVDEDAYVTELLRRLQARGVCAVRGGPSDELALKQGNTESFQYDVHLGNGRPRRSGYTSYCKPARF
jgi:hypothetical protein